MHNTAHTRPLLQTRRALSFFYRALTILLSIALLWFIAATTGWPFMGDATYIHYVVFLTQHGMAPYRDIFEMNMPLTYLIEHAVITIFGPGAIGWRLFDFALLALAIASCITILRPQGILPGLFAGILFALIHGQDGVMMAGERDLQVAVLQVAGIAFLLLYLRKKEVPFAKISLFSLLFACGLCLGMATCIKPTAALLFAALIIWLLWRLRQHKILIFSPLATVLSGSALPLLLSLLYLWHHGSFLAFWNIVHGLMQYHTTLERKPLLFLIGHVFSPILSLFILYIILALWRHSRAITQRRGLTFTSDRCLLVLCTLACWVDYALQGKGFSYQRYPFLIFLLLLMSSEWFESLQSDTSSWKRAITVATLSIAALLALFFAHRASTYSHANPYDAMVTDITAVGGPNPSHTIQCMDTAGGCIASLYQQRIVQSTGFLYDCYFVDGATPVVKNLRSKFETAFQKNPPRIVLITDSVCYNQSRSFNKFASWPTFNQDLQQHYTLVLERDFSRPIRYWNRPQIPFSYRIYIRKP